MWVRSVGSKVLVFILVTPIQKENIPDVKLICGRLSVCKQVDGLLVCKQVDGLSVCKQMD
jgi:hypothetical protein